jgi:hypothetical protein
MATVSAATTTEESNMTSLFKSYEFKNPQNARVEKIGGVSYVFAAIIGPLYIVLKGFWGRFFLHLLIIQPVVLLVPVVVLMMMSVAVSGRVQFVFAVIFILAYLPMTAAVTIWGTRTAYLRSGWQEVSQ